LLSQAIGATDSNWVVQAKVVYAERLPAYGAEMAARMQLWATLGLATPALTVADLANLPEYSFFLYLPFTLAAPYLSKDDEPFYIHENPVRKESVFHIPMVSATGWKGALRAALRYTLGVDDADERLLRLCGNPKGEQSEFRRGRLTFFPTFFDQLSVDVINPHHRHTGSGSQPIALEQVPAKAKGTLALLYTPLPEAVLKKTERRYSSHQLAYVDAALMLQAVYFMLRESGFGAKTTAGMGHTEFPLPAPGYFILPMERVAERLPEPLALDDLRALPALSKHWIPPVRKGDRHD